MDFFYCYLCFYYDHFIKTDLWKEILMTKEDSPYHRERNLAEHIKMACRFYENNFIKRRNAHQQKLTLMACLFHDSGKALIKKTDKDDHANISVRIWNEYTINNKSMVSLLGISNKEIEQINFIIRSHENYRELKRGEVLYHLGDEGHRAWIDFLICNKHGRICDDHISYINEFEEWLDVYFKC